MTASDVSLDDVSRFTSPRPRPPPAATRLTSPRRRSAVGRGSGTPAGPDERSLSTIPRTIVPRKILETRSDPNGSPGPTLTVRPDQWIFALALRGSRSYVLNDWVNPEAQQGVSMGP
jgi:hypothetical protein